MKCRLCQWMISHALDCDQPLPAWVAWHVAGCRACRAHYDAIRELDGALRDGATRRPEFPHHLHTRIMARVRAETPLSPAPVRYGRPAWVAAGLAFLLLLGGWWVLRPGPAPERRGPVPISAARPTLAVTPTTEFPRFDAWVRRLDSALGRTPDAPFETETAALQKDLTDATRFLLACLGNEP